MSTEMENPFGFDPELDIIEDIPEAITKKDKYVYLTKPQIESANNWSIEVGYNRALEPKALTKYL